MAEMENILRGIEIGDRVEWQYTHHLNSKSSVERVKSGTVMRIYKPKKKYLSDYVLHMAEVLFDGNKTNSRVRLDKLQLKD